MIEICLRLISYSIGSVFATILLIWAIDSPYATLDGLVKPTAQYVSDSYERLRGRIASSPPTLISKNNQWRFVEVQKVIDAQTIEVIDNAKPMTLKVAGIDTPKIDGRCKEETAKGTVAKRIVQQLIHDAKIEFRPVYSGWLQTIKSGWIKGRSVELRFDGRSLGETLINNGIARPFNGGLKKGWC